MNECMSTSVQAFQLCLFVVPRIFSCDLTTALAVSHMTSQLGNKPHLVQMFWTLSWFENGCDFTAYLLHQAGLKICGWVEETCLWHHIHSWSGMKLRGIISWVSTLCIEHFLAHSLILSCLPYLIVIYCAVLLCICSLQVIQVNIIYMAKRIYVAKLVTDWKTKAQCGFPPPPLNCQQKCQVWVAHNFCPVWNKALDFRMN